ncbi:hypothetical protein AQJ30_15885 [Streptomyces longwoodensis]|uniref:Uncharacterized protein n=1 Tax=Streptomyces longwoodensis TaxID=68231 RepID=A0A101QXB6_9ACTN|nr:hypothetical protein AQJ30_15885 [Streptomyces longwoodensis]
MLLQQAARRARLSARQAAKRASMSDARWRHIVNGYESVGRGMKIPVTAPAETLARMAQAVGVTSQQLDEAGRPDAAEILNELAPPPPSSDSATHADAGAGGPYGNDPHLDAITALLASLPPEAQDEVLRRLGRTHPSAHPEHAEPAPEQRRTG